MKRLHFLYTHDNATGYGRMGTQLARQFEAMGIEVVDHLRERDNDAPAPAALWASLPNNVTGWYQGQHRALLTMWEATRLPETIRESLHNLDQLFVPSQQNAELFRQYHRAVTYVPLGIDPLLWRYRARRAPTRSFVFLADGRGPRKGTDITVKAFRVAFPRDQRRTPRPTLRLKGSWGARYANQDVTISAARLDDQAEVDLYASAHCYLAPARGEGWGLQPLQAIAQGMPTILTDAHGQAAFAHLGWPLRSKMAPAEYFLFGDPGEWWEPDFDQLVDTMRWVYDNYEAACERAALSSAVALDRFTWANSARAIIDGLPYLDAELPLTEWFDPDYRLYPMVVRLPWGCQVAGQVYHFTPGKLYHERAEIKRMAFQAGCLDPACLEVEGADNGLLPAQLEAVGAVSAAHEACPYCGQQLNSKPLWEYSDEDMAVGAEV